LSKKTLKAVKDTGNEAVMQVKGNQEKLLKNCEAISRNQKKNSEYCSVNQSRSRMEQRKITVYQQPKFNDQIWNKYLNAVVKVERKVERFDAKTKNTIVTEEIAYYVSTTTFSAKKFGQIIQGHWGIENKNHYVKDVSMGEDKSRIRNNPQNMARLRSFALNESELTVRRISAGTFTEMP